MKDSLFIFLVVAFLSCNHLLGQTMDQMVDHRISGTYDDYPLIDVLKDFKEQTGVDFYFKEQWIDTINVVATFDEIILSEALEFVLAEKQINYIIYDNKVFLTGEVIVINNLPMVNSFTNQDTSTNSMQVNKGVIFTKDYISSLQEKSVAENSIYEVGKRLKNHKETTSTIAGYIKNERTNEPIFGALIYLENSKKHALTDNTGFYSLPAPLGKNKLIIRSQGMQETFRNVIVLSSGSLNIAMEESITLLSEVSVSAERDQNVLSVQSGIDKITVEKVKNVPLVLGESDILKIATTKAGVQTLGEGAAGFNVRGGKADQNLILINGSPVYNPNHFLGFFSVFNSDAISEMELYKSSIPAQFGGRLSSIFDIKSKVANTEKIKGKAGVSPVASKLTLEVPLIKDRAGLLVSGRTTYSNWLLRNINNASFSENEVSFYDMLIRVDHKMDQKNSFTLSAYMSGDNFSLSSDTLFSLSKFSFANKNISAKWKHIISPSLDMVTSAGVANYGYELVNEESIPNAFRQDFGTTETSFNVDFDYYPLDKHEFNFGLQSKLYDVNPGSKFAIGAESTVVDEVLSKESGLESALFVSDNYTLNDRFSIYGGLRYSFYQALGPADVLRYEPGLPRNPNTVVGASNFNSGEILKSYQGLEWRFSTRYAFDYQRSIKFAINRNIQYIHILSNSASLSPTDTWKLSDAFIRPQIGDQVSLGYYQNLKGGMIEASVETYYKRLQDLVDFKTNASFLLNENLEQVVLQGPGRSYGVEFSLNKKGKLNGWFNYTFSRSFIKLDGVFAEETVNQGQYFPTNYDRPHNINIVSNYKVTRRFSVSFNATYNSGRLVTLPVAVFNYRGLKNLHFSDRNEYRIPDYFRLDVGINIEGSHKIKKLAHSFWSISIYNVTGRENPFSVFFDVEDGQVRGSQLIIFGNAIPTVSFNFSF